MPPEVKLEIHDAPACGAGNHSNGCTPNPGYTEVCSTFDLNGKQVAICVHWPPVDDYLDLSELECSVVDQREKRA